MDLGIIKTMILQEIQAHPVEEVNWDNIHKLTQIALDVGILKAGFVDAIKSLYLKCVEIDSKFGVSVTTVDGIQRWAITMPQAKIGHSFHGFESRDEFMAFYEDVYRNAQRISDYMKSTTPTEEKEVIQPRPTVPTITKPDTLSMEYWEQNRNAKGHP